MHASDLSPLGMTLHFREGCYTTDLIHSVASYRRSSTEAQLAVAGSGTFLLRLQLFSCKRRPPSRSVQRALI